MSLGPAKGTFFLTAVLAACVTAALPFARDHSLFGGHGFGTVVASILFWRCWALIGHVTGDVAKPGDQLVTVMWVVAAYAIFIVPAIAIRFAAQPGNARRTAFTLLTWFVAYSILLLVFPQATSGP